VIHDIETDTAVVASLGGKAAPDIETAGIKPPPEAAIVSPLPGRQFDSEMLEVKVVAEDMGGGIAEVRLYQNGKILPREAAAKVAKDGSNETHLFQVRLVVGENRFKVVALSSDRGSAGPRGRATCTSSLSGSTATATRPSTSRTPRSTRRGCSVFSSRKA